jgi:hypothetical protein
MKLTRKQIREGLEQMPIDSLLLGAQGAKETRLTAKQKEFARAVAMGETKASAYRKAYKTNGKPQTQSQEGTRLMNDPKIAAYTEAINRALEVQRLQTPQHLRALVVSELTKHAIDENLPPAQRLRALQLLGTVTEVAAFTERREVIKTTNSQEARAQLVDSLMHAIKQGATDVDDTAAADLLAELNAGADANTIDAEPAGVIDADAEPPPTPDPLNAERDSGGASA